VHLALTLSRWHHRAPRIIKIDNDMARAPLGALTGSTSSQTCRSLSSDMRVWNEGKKGWEESITVERLLLH